MTSHLEEGRLQELLDGEIPSPALPPIQAHLAVCAECRARLDEARAIGAEADRLIGTIDLTEKPSMVAPRIPRARSKAWIRNVAWAATVILAAGVGYLARNPDAVRPAEEMAAREPTATPVVPPAAGAEPEASDPRLQPPAAERARGETKPTTAGMLRQLAAAVDSDSVRKKAPGRLGDSPLRLEEIVTTGVNDGRAAASPPALAPLKQSEKRAPSPDTTRVNANRREEMAVAKAAAAPVEITVQEARKRLDGSLHLIEGLVPLRIEVLGSDIRVVYQLGSAEVLLVERLENGKLTYRLVAPAGFPADSLDRLRARVRD